MSGIEVFSDGNSRGFVTFASVLRIGTELREEGREGDTEEGLNRWGRISHPEVEIDEITDIHDSSSSRPVSGDSIARRCRRALFSQEIEFAEYR